MIPAGEREAVLALARRAGDAIMAIYRAGFAVDYKDDRSPLTEADLASHRLLVDGLSALPSALPVLSEESAAAVPLDQRRRWSRYWLVDPLDGTREFVKRNDEFTINIALVEDGVAGFGLVYAPALDEMAFAGVGEGAWIERAGAARQALRTRASPPRPVLTISRSHAGSGTDWLLDSIGPHGTLAAGSALKFIRLAEGAADLYPRLGPTSEWDTAAGQCLLEVAGGSLSDFQGRPFRYNQRDTVLNGGFLAVADPTAGWFHRLAPVMRRLEGDHG